MNNFKQTWWDDNLKERLAEFEFWVGDKTAYSKAFFRKYVMEKGYKSLIDLGCGNATEYAAYKEEYPELKYLGVDSSKFFYDKNTDLGIPMMWASGENIPLVNGHSEVVFARHVLEHQPHFEPLISEMVRLASREAIHVFFIAPGDKEHIGYNESENLYHNRFDKGEIEKFLMTKQDVESFSWIALPEYEVALSVIKKPLE